MCFTLECNDKAYNVSEWVYLDMDIFSFSLNFSSLIVENLKAISKKFCSLSRATIEESINQNKITQKVKKTKKKAKNKKSQKKI